MAKRLNYQIGFTADTSELSSAVSKAVESLNKVSGNLGLTTEMREASTAAQELAGYLNSAFDATTGKLDLASFNDSLEQSGKTIQDYANDLSKMGTQGEQAFMNVASAITTAELPLKRSNQLLDELWTTMKNTMRWQLTSSALHEFVGTLESAYGYAQDLNESLTNIRIVTEKSTEDMAAFAEQANEAAKALSTTTTDYTDAALIYYQQGDSDEEVLAKTETTIKMANVAGESAETVSDQLTAIWNNFYDGSQSLEYYADVMVRLGADTATSSDEIAEGMQKFASVANTIGLSYEYAAAALTTITATTRESADTVGTSLRTIFARLQGLSLGEDLDDGTTLNKYSTALEKVGVSIFDVNGEIKDMDTILDELGNKWGTLSKDVQIATAQTVAGVRQYTQLITLMDNWDFFQENLDTAYSAEGSLDTQAEIYAESWEAARDRVTAAAEDIYDSLINDQFFIGLDDAITPVLSTIADVIDAMGGMKGVINTVGLLMNQVYGDKIAQGLRDLATNIGIVTGKEQERARALQAEAAVAVTNLTQVQGSEEGTETSTRVDIMRQEVALQATINEKYDDLNASEHQAISQAQQRLSVLKEIVLQQQKSASAARENVSESTSNVLSARTADNDLWSDSYDQTITQLTNATQEFKDQMANLVANDDVEAYRQSLLALAQDLTSQAAKVDLITQAYGKLDSSADSYEADLRNILTLYDPEFDAQNASLEQMEQHITALSSSSTDLSGDITLVAQALAGSANETDLNTKDTAALVAQMQALAKRLLEVKSGLTNYEEASEKTRSTIGNLSKDHEDWASKIVKVGSSLSSLTMIMQSFQNLGSIFSNDDLSDGEKLIQIFTSLGMLIPSITTAVKSLSGIFGISTGGATVVLGAVLTSVMAISTALDSVKSQQDVIDDLIESAEELQEAYEELSESYDDFESVVETYEDAVAALDECTKGTEEWSDALDVANESATELISTISSLSGIDWSQIESLYSIVDGQVVISEDALNNISEQYEAQLMQANLVSARADYEATAAQEAYNLETAIANATGASPNASQDDYDDFQAALLDNIDKLTDSSTTLDEFESIVGEIADTYNLQIDDYESLQTALSDYSDGVLGATEILKALAAVDITDILGEDYEEEPGVQEAVVNAYVAEAKSLAETYTDTWSNSIGYFAHNNDATYQTILTKLNNIEGYDYSSAGWREAVQGTSSNRTLTFFNESTGETQEQGIEYWANLIATAEALANVTDNAEQLSTALAALTTGTGEGLQDYLSTGNFESMTQEDFNGLVDQMAAYMRRGVESAAELSEDAINSYLQGALGLDEEQLAEYFGTDNYAAQIQEALVNYETAFDSFMDGMLNATNEAFYDMDIEGDWSVSSGEYMAEALQGAIVYGTEDTVDTLQDTFEKVSQSGSLEDFIDGIEGIDDWTSVVAEDLADVGEEANLTSTELQLFINAMQDTVKATVMSQDELSEYYTSLMDIVEDLETGDTISAEDYNTLIDELGDGVSSCFKWLLDGTYELTADAEEFYDLVASQTIGKIKETQSSYQDEVNSLQKIQGYDFDSLAENQLIGGTTVVYDSVEKQLELIQALGEVGDEIIAGWQEELDSGSISTESLDDIAAEVENCREAYENLDTTIDGLQGTIYELDIAVASSAGSYDELKQMLDEGTISTQAFNDAYLDLWEAARTEDLDTDEIEDYADYLQDIADVSDDLSSDLKNNEKAAKSLATQIMNMNDAVEILADNWEDWADVLQNSSDSSEEYADAVLGTQEALSKLLDIDQEFIGDQEWILANMDDIAAAADGDADAIDRLRASALEDIILNLELEDESLRTQLTTDVAELQAMLDGMGDLKVGTEIDDADFIAACNEMIQSAGLTVDQVKALFSGMGYEVNVKTEPQLVEQRNPYTVTETEITGWTSGTTTGPTGEDVDWKYPILKTHSYNDGYSTDYGYVDAVAMTTDGSSPIIDSVTKKATGTYNNYSSSNAGGNSSGSGSSGGGSGSSSEPSEEEKAETKTLDDIAERYHEINRELENQSTLLSRVSSKVERAFGVAKLKAYDEELRELNNQLTLYNEKLVAAQNYYETDKAAMEDALPEGYTITYDVNMEIEDYDGLMQAIRDEYNAVINEYNAFIDEYNGLATSDLQEAQAEQLEAWQEAKQNADDLLDERLELISTYEETVDELHEIEDTLVDINEEIADNALSKIEYELEVTLTAHDMEDAVRELYEEIAESYSDALYYTPTVATLKAESAQADMDLLSTYQSTYDDLMEQLQNATTETDVQRIMDDLESLQGDIISTAEDLLEFIEYVENMFSDALDAAQDRFDQFIDQLEHNETVLELIEELYELQGVTYKTEEGFAALQNVAQEKMEAQLAEAQLQYAWYTQAKEALEVAEAALEGVSEGDAAYDTLKNNRDALLETYNEALEAMLEAASDAMQTAQDMYLQAVEKAVYDFGQAVSDGIGLDLLADQYDHYIEEEERYLDTVNEAYEVASWYSKLQADIDDTTSSSMKAKLQALQEEIDLRREGNTLSEYDLEILEAKYNVLMAEMALEEAQNAKNNLQLVRDSNGNWNYQYTSDGDAIASAEQDLLDAENEWYNIAKQQVTDVTSEIISTWQECQSEIEAIYSDMTLTDQERADRAAEIYEYYTEKIQYLEEEKQVAIADMTEAGNESLLDMAILFGDTVSDLTGVTSAEIQEIVANGDASIIELLTADSATMAEIVGENTSLLELFDNTYAATVDDMTDQAMNFEDIITTTLDTCQIAFEDYGDTVSSIADSTGTDLESLEDIINDVSDATDECRDVGLDAVEMMWEQLDAILELSMEYAEWCSQIYQVIDALAQLAAATSSTYSSVASVDTITDWSAVAASIATTGSGTDAYGNTYTDLEEVYGYREAKIAALGLTDEVSTQDISDALEAYKNGTLSAAQEAYIESITGLGPYWYEYFDSYDTGGYTGNYEGAKLAMLHGKELVLNEDDTKNMLTAVGAVRQIDFSAIEETLDGKAIAAMTSLASALSGFSQVDMSGEALEQHITIENVEFPNATSADEIKEAFASLANDAAQWAKRRTS